MNDRDIGQKYFFWNRSGAIFAGIALIIGLIVNFDQMETARRRYLSGIYAKGGFKNAKDGVLYYESLSRLGPDAVTMRELGKCYAALNDDDQARAAYRKAEEISRKQRERK